MSIIKDLKSIFIFTRKKGTLHFGITPIWDMFEYHGDEAMYESFREGDPAKYMSRHLHLGKNVILNQAYAVLHSILEGGADGHLGANAQIGVGNSNAAESATHGGLQGGSTYYQVVDAGPTHSGTNGEIATYVVTVADGDAEFNWQEAVMRNGDATETDLTRIIQDMGVKSPGLSRALQITATLSEV